MDVWREHRSECAFAQDGDGEGRKGWEGRLRALQSGKLTDTLDSVRLSFFSLFFYSTNPLSLILRVDFNFLSFFKKSIGSYVEDLLGPKLTTKEWRGWKDEVGRLVNGVKQGVH